jgi:hypothetical protein
MPNVTVVSITTSTYTVASSEILRLRGCCVSGQSYFVFGRLWPVSRVYLWEELRINVRTWSELSGPSVPLQRYELVPLRKEYKSAPDVDVRRFWLVDWLFHDVGIICQPIAMAAPSKAWTVFTRSNTGVVGLNPTQGIDVCVRLFCVCVVSYAGSGLEMGSSPIQGVLPTVNRINNLKKRPRSNKRM